MPDFDAAVDARMRRWQEQRWILDAVIQTLGVEWDQARIGYCLAPCGPQATADFMGVRQRVRRFSDISREFARAADRRRALGERHEREGHPITARADYFTAAVLYGSAQWPIFAATGDNLRLDALKVECFGNYARLADHPVQRVEIPFGGGVLPAWLHLPATGSPPYPCVLSIDGMDGFKEMMHSLAGDGILGRGMASLAIDGPGQGECPLHGLHVGEDNFAAAGRAALDWLRARPEIDSERLAVRGVSFGSLWATQVAAADPGLRACAVAYVCHEPGGRAIFETASPTFKLRFMFMAGYSDEDAFDRFRSRLTLEGTGARVGCPYLVVAGEEDELSPIEYTNKLLAEMSAPRELLLYQGERHGLHSGPASALGPDDQAYVADWLADRLQGRPMPASRRVYVDVSGRQTETPL